MKAWILASVVVFSGIQAMAGVDFKCALQCQSAGGSYGECQVKCDDHQSPFQTKQVDQKCASDCQSAGYNYGYCQSKCSY